MRMKTALLMYGMMAAAGSMHQNRPQVEVTGKALHFPPEQPKLSKKAKAKQKARTKK